MAEWSDWIGLNFPANPVQPSCGTYQVRLVDAAGKPIAIPRALGIDHEGIVYIGEGQLGSRIGRLWDITREDVPKGHHDLAATWVAYNLDRLGDRRLLQVRYLVCDDHELREKELLNEYKRRFGDIPVGNLTIGFVPCSPPTLVAPAPTL